MAGIGFSFGDILASGTLCYQIYTACFSESDDSIASWNYLGRELHALGAALNTLAGSIVPPHMQIGGNQGQIQKQEQTLEAVRMVVGDFKETLQELKTMLLEYADFRTAGGARLYWLKVKFCVNSGDLDKFRTKIAMHTRAVNLLLNPLIYSDQVKGIQTSQHNIQTSVSNIQTRIDTVDQVLHALLFVASEQLTSNTPRIPNSSRVGAVDSILYPPKKHLLGSSPMDVQTIPSLLSGVSSGVPMEAQEMMRSTSYSAEVQNVHSLSMGDVRRRATDPRDSIQPSFFCETTTSRPGRRKHDFLDRESHKDMGAKHKEKYSLDKRQYYHAPLSESPPTTPNFPSPTSQQKALVRSVESGENPIDAALRQQVESNEAQYIPIEHWITAAMHWYFKAESELDEKTEGHEVSSEAYLGLMKSTWIVENVIRQWDSEAGLPRGIRINVETLIVSIVDKFSKMRSWKMPDIRNLSKHDFEIWHQDIREILVKPTSPLALSTYPITQESATRKPSWARHEECPPRRESASSSSERSVISDICPHQIISTSPGSPPRVGEDMFHELGDLNEWSESIFALTSSNCLNPTAMGETKPSAKHNTIYDRPVSRRATLEMSPQSLPVGVGSVPRRLDMGGSPPEPSDQRPATMFNVQRSPSASTTSTSSSGRETLDPPRSPGCIPGQREPLPPITRPTFSEEIDRIESTEMVGERLVLDTIPVLWASRSTDSFTAGSLKIFWHQSEEYFRLFTAWDRGRSNSQDIPLSSMELIPAYAYEEEPIIYLRKVNQRLSAPSNTAGTSPSTRNEMFRRGFVYKFNTSKEMLKFQTALTGEDVYQDLVKRVSAVKFKRLTERGDHTYHNARLQLWHEKPPSDSLLPDTASGFTGMSQATRFKLSLQWSRLVIYLGGSDCFITCFVTDDITLEREGNTLSLIPTKYSAKDFLFKSPKSVKARLVGGDHAKGGFRLDKDRISWNDEHDFENFSNIQITFRETLYLNRFETLWNRMMNTRRRSRTNISALKKEIERTTYAPSYSN